MPQRQYGGSKMARKYEYMPERYAWNFEKCEEEVVIAAYDEICRFIPPDLTWKADFETHFFDHGNGVAVEFLDLINAVRTRRGLAVIAIRETDVYDYGRTPDKLLKSNQRRRVRDELTNARLDVRQRRIELAMAEAARLPPPHMTYEDYKARREQLKTESVLSFEEVRKRVLALEAAKPPAKLTLLPERAARMLTLASPNIWGEIIPRLSAEDALDVAEKITDAELRDALIKHSLGGS
jgi:hypothetical protein